MVSEKKDIAVFKLSYYKWSIPEAVLGGIDEQIKGVFINIGRFNVLGMTQRLEEGDVNAFIDKIKEFKQAKAAIPEQVQMGKEFFTEADFNRLIGSFIVVIPAVSNYILEREKNKDYKATISTSFTFVNVEQASPFSQFFVETSGSDKNAEQAVKAAMDAIALQLTFQIRNIPEFQLKTGILEVKGAEVIFELGRDMGIKVGDEYVIIASRVLASGKMYAAEKGLLIVKEVSDEVSVGRVIYADNKPQVGDQLKEVPRLGFESFPYLHVALTGMSEEGEATALAGIRISPTRGFYDFRPILGFEIPFIRNLLWGIPFNLYVGGEYNVYLGKLQVVPMASFGFGAAYLWYLKYLGVEEKGDDFIFSHLGGTANLTLSYLLNRNIKLTLEGGYLYWFSLDPTSIFMDDSLLFKSYGGPFVGAGVGIKF